MMIHVQVYLHLSFLHYHYYFNFYFFNFNTSISLDDEYLFEDDEYLFEDKSINNTNEQLVNNIKTIERFFNSDFIILNDMDMMDILLFASPIDIGFITSSTSSIDSIVDFISFILLSVY